MSYFYTYVIFSSSMSKFFFDMSYVLIFLDIFEINLTEK